MKFDQEKPRERLSFPPLLPALLLAACCSCVNVSSFDKPNLHEAFSGSLRLVPSLDFYSQVNTPTIVDLSGGGEHILVTGITGTAPLPIGMQTDEDIVGKSLKGVMKLLRAKKEDDNEQISDLEFTEALLNRAKFKLVQVRPEIPSLVGRALSRDEIEINGFPHLSEITRELKPTVSGRLVRDGPSLYTDREHPIVIQVNTRALVESFFRQFQRDNDIPAPNKTSSQDLMEADLASHFGPGWRQRQILPLKNYLQRRYYNLADMAATSLNNLQQDGDFSENLGYTSNQDGSLAAGEPPSSDKEKDKPAATPFTLDKVREIVINRFTEDERFPVWQITFEGEIITVL